MSWNNDRFLFLDCQTTATHPSQGQILEIAWCISTLPELLSASVENYLVALPEGEQIPYRVREMTKISDQEMQDAKPQSEVMQILREQIGQQFPDGKVPTVAHYAVFEKTFLQAAWQNEFPNDEFPFEFLCTQKIAKFVFPGMTSFNLRAVSGFFGSTLHLDNRASSHVDTTIQVWLGIVRELETRAIHNAETLAEQMSVKKPKKKTDKKSFEYRMPREKRLQFPDQPGIYKMFSKGGQILYVGKATSLKSRVNSYFRGGTTKDKRKQELMAQVWDIEVVECRSPLEAALLESDEIKKWMPRYNVALRESRRPIVYFDRDFSSLSVVRNVQHPIGPFKGKERLDQLIDFFESLKSGELGQPFWDFVEPDLIEQGWLIFRERHALNIASLQSIREMLAVGMILIRKSKRSDGSDEEHVTDLEESEDLSNEVDEPVLTAEDVADKFERMFSGAASNVRRAQKMQKLLCARVRVVYRDGDPHYLHFLNGLLVSEDDWRRFARDRDSELVIDSASYDRLSILLTGVQSAHDVTIESACDVPPPL